MNPAPRSYYIKNHTPDVLDKFTRGKYQERNDSLFDLLEPLMCDKSHVVDIAAGSSYLAQRFAPLTKVESYLWNDFNPTLVGIVKQETLNAKVTISNFDAERQDVDLSRFNVFICVSLEHIEKDVELIERINSGALVAIGSPNFGGIEHVRFFDTLEAFAARYSNQIEILSAEVLNFEATKKFILVGKRF